ncbi:hypothetical protein BJ878DRAFT_522589 [Calycina marina]|uniref:Mitochondrial inner membrane protein 1 n=1 Tax=Calycina marina TaxID=1763456 RepID=A0A9P8CBK9_9HELO|nr:hypothetical protein BJ878DRAFT_522589 [Calycina marina]
MLRTAASRVLSKSFTKAPPQTIAQRAASTFRNESPFQRSSTKRSQILLLARPAKSSFYATESGLPFDKPDLKAEKQYGAGHLKPHPDIVSSESTTRHVFEARSEQETKKVKGALRQDFETIKDTFALTEVPRESLYIGAAGVLPYAATSLSTVFLASEIKHIHSTGQGWIFSADTAHQLLDWITPIQIGYGAVILSFLGAIHWGLEYAGYGGCHSYRRYLYGVVPTAVAWPTMFMPVEYALITQFTAFTFMYFADARAAVRGWAPPWYSTYRFVLTFLVGASIVLSLVGRGQIINHDGTLRNAVDYVEAGKDTQWIALEQEEKERYRKLAEEEAKGEADEEEDDDKKDKKKGEK